VQHFRPAVTASLLLSTILCAAPATVHGEATTIAAQQAADLTAQARAMQRLHSLLVLQDGQPVIEHTQGGPGLARPANIKSLSKTVLSALAGIAIDRGLIEGTEQALVEILGDRVPDTADRRVEAITVGHALAMQTGLRSTSGRYYGAWVQSADWLDHVLTRPFVDTPGGRMIYSSGATHLVSAALVAASGRSTLTLAREWLGRPLNISIPDWMRDPQGIHFGGNEMRLSPRALARFGEMYRLGGTIDGRAVVPAGWIEASWQPNGRSPWTGDAYGYGWFITDLGGRRAYYGRGYGGQLLMVIPSARLTIVMTSDPRPPSSGGTYFERQRALAESLTDWLQQRSAALPLQTGGPAAG